MQVASFESVNVSEFMVLKISYSISSGTNPSQDTDKYLYVQMMIWG